MATVKLSIDNVPAWEFHHDFPILWNWFFDPASITESRKFHDTLLEAADRFHMTAAKVERNSLLALLAGLFEEIRAESFFEQFGALPDAILSLNISELETERHYSHEEAMKLWEQFFLAAQNGDEKGTYKFLEEATLSPLILMGSPARDALALRAATDALGLPTEDRATALIWCLMGKPVSRPARALTMRWIERASHLPIAEFAPRRGLLRRLIG